MHELTERFVEYCRAHFDLEPENRREYSSLSVCVIDCVYSLRVKYDSVTLPVVDRYAARYLGGDRYAAGDTVSLLLNRMDEMGAERFADEVLRNHQKLGGGRGIPKEAVCYQLARYLGYLRIDSLEDFRRFEAPELLEAVIRAVKGLGDAGTNYLFMLAGDPDRCKPDVHIHRCVQDACGRDIRNEECQLLFAETVERLRPEHPRLTVRGLDRIIWKASQRR